MKRIIAGLLCIMFMVSFVSCAGAQDTKNQTSDRNISSELVYDHSMELEFAKEFSVDFYRDGYALISTSEGSRFLVVPDMASVPKDIDTSITILKQPVSNIYLVASAVMDMFCSMDALDRIRLSGTREDSWYIEDARQAMKDDCILYAGKYSAPDYELILSQQCDLAIQSTMITHSPEVKEKLEAFGIPVLVDYSSYEEHPLGRSEWIKLYGVLTQKEAEAEEAFLRQKEALETVAGEEATGKTVAFFYITSNGAASVRRSGDYIPKMIELAGGTYIFQELGKDEGAFASINMQMEEFYAKAKDADYIIYNGIIDGGVSSMKELLAKSSLLKDFKAVQEGKVWCATQNLYQSTMELGTMIADIHKMLTTEDGPDEKFTCLYRLE